MKNKIMSPLLRFIFNGMLGAPQLEESIEFKNFEKEEVTYEKGDFITTITHYFSEDGYMIGTKTETKLKEKDKNSLLEKYTKQKEEALEKEDYLLVSKLHTKINELKGELKNSS
jgi:hypothetical protein